MTTLVPQRAHAKAAAVSAAHAAQGILSTYTGTLARDVSKPKPEGPLTALIGSALPYAAVEHFGGPINSSRKMYIRGRGVSAGGILASGAVSKRGYLLRSSANKGRYGFNPVSGEVRASGIAATAFSVPHPAKLYLDRAVRLYPDAFVAFAREFFP